MTEDNNNNNVEYSRAIPNKSKKGSQNKELLKVLEALESQGFRLFDYHENWFGSSLNIKWLEHLTILNIKTNPGTVLQDYDIFIMYLHSPFLCSRKNLTWDIH